MEKQAEIPAGWRMNTLGHLVPEDKIPELDKLRDEMVNDLIGRAREMAARMDEFKLAALAQIESFVEVAAQEHGVRLGGAKGNLSFVSYDGRYKIIRAVDEHIAFTEAMSLAREEIFECIRSWTEGANGNLVELVTRAFEPDRDGHLSASKILALRSYRIDDPKWRHAMDMIGEAIRVQSTVHYLRFYVRDGRDKWRQIALDGSRLE